MTETGLLDDTHVSFFSSDRLRSMTSDVGLGRDRQERFPASDQRPALSLRRRQCSRTVRRCTTCSWRPRQVLGCGHRQRVRTGLCADGVHRVGAPPGGRQPTPVPFVSVLMRTQGTRPATLQEALLSLAAQTDQDFEVLVLAHNVPRETADPSPLPGRCVRRADFGSRVSVIPVDGGGRTRPLTVGSSGPWASTWRSSMTTTSSSGTGWRRSSAGQEASRAGPPLPGRRAGRRAHHLGRRPARLRGGRSTAMPLARAVRCSRSPLGEPLTPLRVGGSPIDLHRSGAPVRRDPPGPRGLGRTDAGRALWCGVADPARSPLCGGVGDRVTRPPRCTRRTNGTRHARRSPPSSMRSRCSCLPKSMSVHPGQPDQIEIYRKEAERLQRELATGRTTRLISKRRHWRRPSSEVETMRRSSSWKVSKPIRVAGTHRTSDSQVDGHHTAGLMAPTAGSSRSTPSPTVGEPPPEHLDVGWSLPGRCGRGVPLRRRLR